MENPIYLIKNEGYPSYIAVPLTPKNIWDDFSDKKEVIMPFWRLSPWTDIKLLNGKASGVSKDNLDGPNNIEIEALEELIEKIKTEFNDSSVTAVILSHYTCQCGPSREKEGEYEASFTLGAIGCNIQKK